MRKTTLGLLAAAVLGCVALALGAFLGDSSGRSDDHEGDQDRGVLAATGVYAIDTTSKAAVNHAFQTRWRPALSAAAGWTGATSGCRKGAVSAEFVGHLARAVNFVRALNKVDAVAVRPDRYSSSSTYSTQATALMMHANKAVSHHPPSSWACYTRVGASAARHSNLSLTFYGDWTAGRALEAYLDDSGPGNEAAGHRRWLTSPWVQTLYVGGTENANALMPVTATRSDRANPPFTSWPTQGYFPTQLEPMGRWSWSTRDSSADLSRARVQVWKAGQELTVQQHGVHAGYGQPSLVWRMPAESRRTGVYTVKVSGVRSAGGALRPACTYRVRGFVAWAE